MRTLSEYMALPYRLEILQDPDEGGYIASYPDLPGCATCADDLNSVVELAQDAKKEWIAAALETGVEIPEPDSLTGYSGQFKLRVPKSLHRSLAAHAKDEGTSMNQYCVYLLSKNDALAAAK